MIVLWGPRVIGYASSVTVDGIKDLVERLPPVDRAALAAWICAREQRDWDAEIERDFSEGGAGMGLMGEVDILIDSGNRAAER